jgi:hypothetical protein
MIACIHLQDQIKGIIINLLPSEFRAAAEL